MDVGRFLHHPSSNLCLGKRHDDLEEVPFIRFVSLVVLVIRQMSNDGKKEWVVKGAKGKTGRDGEEDDQRAQQHVGQDRFNPQSVGRGSELCLTIRLGCLVANRFRETGGNLALGDVARLRTLEKMLGKVRVAGSICVEVLARLATLSFCVLAVLALPAKVWFSEDSVRKKTSQQ